MISFDKMHGNGNDFIVLNSIENTYKVSKSIIKKLSDRNFGIGFDQLILIGPPTKDSFDFSIRFFNADGGEASMCLNGIRCAAAYVWRNNFAPRRLLSLKLKIELWFVSPTKTRLRQHSRSRLYILILN